MQHRPVLRHERRTSSDHQTGSSKLLVVDERNYIMTPITNHDACGIREVLSENRIVPVPKKLRLRYVGDVLDMTSLCFLNAVSEGTFWLTLKRICDCLYRFLSESVRGAIPRFADTHQDWLSCHFDPAHAHIFGLLSMFRTLLKHGRYNRREPAMAGRPYFCKLPYDITVLSFFKNYTRFTIFHSLCLLDHSFWSLFLVLWQYISAIIYLKGNLDHQVILWRQLNIFKSLELRFLWQLFCM